MRVSNSLSLNYWNTHIKFYRDSSVIEQYQQPSEITPLVCTLFHDILLNFASFRLQIPAYFGAIPRNLKLRALLKACVIDPNVDNPKP